MPPKWAYAITQRGDGSIEMAVKQKRSSPWLSHDEAVIRALLADLSDRAG